MEEARIYRISDIQGDWFQQWVKQRAYLSVLFWLLVPVAVGLVIGFIRVGRVVLTARMITSLLPVLVVGGIVVTLMSMWTYSRQVARWSHYQIQLLPDRIIQHAHNVADVTIMRDEIDKILRSKHYGLRILVGNGEKQISITQKIDRFGEIVEALAGWHTIEDVKPLSVYRIPFPVSIGILVVGFVILLEAKAPWLIAISMVIFLLYLIMALNTTMRSTVYARGYKMFSLVMYIGLVLASIVRFIWSIVR